MRISLVLGSGGARGYAHIGVIEELLARGHEVVALSGASMGALVGGMFAAGKLDDFADFARGLHRGDVMRLTDLTLREPGLVKAQRLMSELHSLVGDVRIEDLPIPYVAVATDVRNRREVWFKEGALLPAIRASISIPTVFTPVMMGDRLLVDGGVLNPMPVEPSMHQVADITVGVSLMGRRHGDVGGTTPAQESADETHEVRWTDWLTDSMRDTWAARAVFHRFHSRKEANLDDPYQELPGDLTIGDILSMSLDSMQAAIQASRLALNGPDVMVEVPVDTCSTLDFHLAEDVIEVGRGLARVEFDRQGL